jgi:hypothetical protein
MGASVVTANANNEAAIKAPNHITYVRETANSPQTVKGRPDFAANWAISGPIHVAQSVAVEGSKIPTRCNNA